MKTQQTIVHVSRVRRVESGPFISGRASSLFGLPLGFASSASQCRIGLPGRSKGPTEMSLMKLMPAVSGSDYGSRKG